MSNIKCFKLGEAKTLVVAEGDITKSTLDAIVNPANSLLVMGGGVAGAIKRAGGEIIEKEALRFAPIPVGEAVVTSAGRLKAKYVIHAPTMERPAMPTSKEKVSKATLAALKKAFELGVNSIALPAMGAGVGGLSIRDSIEAMLEQIIAWKEPKPKVIALIAYGHRAFEEMVEVVRRVLGEAIECPVNLRVFQ